MKIMSRILWNAAILMDGQVFVEKKSAILHYEYQDLC